MEPIIHSKYLMLSLLVIAWCVIHSAMISVSVTEYLKKRLGLKFLFYRLFFNFIAILTLIPVVLFASSIQTQAIFHWTGVFLLLFGIGFIVNSASLVFFFTPLYVLINVWELKKIKEPELIKRLGDEYIEYQRRTPMFIPGFRPRSK